MKTGHFVVEQARWPPTHWGAGKWTGIAAIITSAVQVLAPIVGAIIVCAAENHTFAGKPLGAIAKTHSKIVMQETFIHHTAVIDAGASIGSGTRIWHYCHVMPGAIIGNGCNIGQNVFVDNQARVGNGVKIQNNVSVYHGVVLEDDVFVGPSAVFTNVVNPRSFIERKNEFKPTLVQKGASIGANATIVCGITIGPYALIGAGAVVTKDVPAHALVTGNPARQTGWVSQAGHKLDFGTGDTATCAETGQQYILQQNQVTLL